MDQVLLQLVSRIPSKRDEPIHPRIRQDEELVLEIRVK